MIAVSTEAHREQGEKGITACCVLPALFMTTLVAGCQSGPQVGLVDKYEVRRETSSSLCSVKLTTAAPGAPKISGPFATRKEACTSALSLYDGDGTEEKKCWSYDAGSKQGCAADGVSLP